MKNLILLISCLIYTISLTAQDTIQFKDLSSGDNVRGQYDHYIAKDGHLYTVGDTLHLGRPGGQSNIFQHVVYQVGLGTEPATASENAGQRIVIRNIRVAGSRRGGYEAIFRTSGRTVVESYHIHFEKALEIGEIKGKGINRDDAINQLTEAKQLLDLEIITQEEYDKIREELTPIIRGDK